MFDGFCVVSFLGERFESESNSDDDVETGIGLVRSPHDKKAEGGDEEESGAFGVVKNKWSDRGEYGESHAGGVEFINKTGGSVGAEAEEGGGGNGENGGFSSVVDKDVDEDEAGECSEEEGENLGVRRKVDEFEVHIDEEELEGGGAVAVEVRSPAVAGDGAANVVGVVNVGAPDSEEG